MELRKLFTDERAVSPVVGVALLIAIAVILAAVIGAVVLGLGTGGAETPQAQMQAEFVDTNSDGNGDIVVNHKGGEPLPGDEVIVKLEGASGGETTVDLSSGISDDELNAGESATFEGTAFGTSQDVEAATLVWEDPNSDSETVLEEFEA